MANDQMTAIFRATVNLRRKEFYYFTKTDTHTPRALQVDRKRKNKSFKNTHKHRRVCSVYVVIPLEPSPR
jgi:hypothetical protein